MARDGIQIGFQILVQDGLEGVEACLHHAEGCGEVADEGVGAAGRLGLRGLDGEDAAGRERQDLTVAVEAFAP